MLQIETFINIEVYSINSMVKEYNQKYAKLTVDKVRSLLCHGFKSPEIAKRLGLHPVTVRNIKRQIRKRYEKNEI